MQAENKVVFKYDGESLKNHKISLEVLANSLSGLNSLLNETNLKVNGTSDNIQLKVEAFQPGSFEIVLDVMQNPQEYVDILAAIGFGAAAVLAGKDSLISAMHKLEGRQIQKLSFLQDGDCKVTLSDDESFPVPAHLKSLLASTSVRTALSKLIHAPLQEDGVESFKVLGADRSEITVISKEQSSAFKYKRIPVTQSTVDKLYEDVIFTFVTVHKDKTTWRVDLDGEIISAVIKDDDFVACIKKGEEGALFSSSYTANLIVKEDLNSMDKTYFLDKVHVVV
ncbi:hypothetical protein [Vibrio toranzoniae]|uniref:hypothetical protein n=1 Tax=Vibrio toranzoniae TaxID=1194427 RepID=UPI0009BDCEFC|nr:hypothetical protein [Vibrio toranzoniae]NAZ92225.1 hypothetical protein [Vibrio toranzoniae]OQQ01135.1 hypothetical protein BK411_24135 [Vibrio splendidus]